MDKTKCSGEGCLIKDKCFRFTSKKKSKYQSYFVEPPFKKTETQFSCDMFWGENQNQILNMLTSVVKGDANGE
jgi:hypothetical protein